MTSQIRGGIEVNEARLPELLQALVSAFSDQPVYLAVWHPENLDISLLPSHIISDELPLHGNWSILPGSVLILVVDPETFPAVLAAGVCNAIHLEMSSNGTMRFAAYDYFSSVCFWDGVTPGMLAALKKEGMILDYNYSTNH